MRSGDDVHLCFYTEQEGELPVVMSEWHDLCQADEHLEDEASGLLAHLCRVSRREDDPTPDLICVEPRTEEGIYSYICTGVAVIYAVQQGAANSPDQVFVLMFCRTRLLHSSQNEYVISRADLQRSKDRLYNLRRTEGVT